MRTIKFRGKTRDGAWLYGDLIVKHHENGDSSGIHNDKDYDLVYQVIPETVGQFTGESDKNNKEVYEGDIVKYGLLYYDNSIQPCIGNVVFDNCSFAIKNNAKNVNNCYLHQTIDYGEKLEVIGNIHDNPELLNVQ